MFLQSTPHHLNRQPPQVVVAPADLPLGKALEKIESGRWR